MKSILPILLTAVVAILAQSAAGVEPAGGPPRHKPWRLVFSDEFDGSKLDESKWTRSRSSMPAFVWNGAKGRLCEDHADVDGQGHSVIKVTRDTDGTYCYHHGVQTKGKFQRTYGKQYWGNYQPLPAKTVRLAEGTHVLRVRFDATPFNFGGLEFSPAADAARGK
jgi:hypothetical protein